MLPNDIHKTHSDSSKHVNFLFEAKICSVFKSLRKALIMDRIRSRNVHEDFVACKYPLVFAFHGNFSF